ncbi:hypothetical protein L873DRAFT_1799805 [Choiromyces venosus 120613-1]|uniref:Uncharacterized protein n=1 Tax=Choiromyces venosus 120613-1 TaxID=1336337 RepID=A0A3N4K515_9PEZI|nr:hypothetical protein L873DRAFT_1799805 [Choiromyces venosus 120613-1]
MRLGTATLMCIYHPERPFFKADEQCLSRAVKIEALNLNSNKIPSIGTLLAYYQGLIMVNLYSLVVAQRLLFQASSSTATFLQRQHIYNLYQVLSLSPLVTFGCAIMLDEIFKEIVDAIKARTPDMLTFYNVHPKEFADIHKGL